jgi:hypothetical protein
MPNLSRPSASVIAAAVVGILASLFLLLVGAITFLGFLLNASLNTAPGLPPSARILMLVMAAFMMGVSIFGIATGIGLLLLRNWARISILIWGGLSVFFGVVGIPFAFLMPLSEPAGTAQLPPGTMRMIHVMLSIIYGLPLAVGTWWLILFNRKTIKAQFAGTTPPFDAALPQKPRCPLPVTVLAWFYVTLLLNLFFLPFFSAHPPIFLFGMRLPDGIGLGILLLSCLAFTISGIGILKLKPWGYSLAMGLQAFWITSSIASMLRPNYKAAMEGYFKEIESSMQLPASQFAANPFMQHFNGLMGAGLVFSGAILGLFIYYRQRFLAAASAAASSR